jgi:hypothetical protein
MYKIESVLASCHRAALTRWRSFSTASYTNASFAAVRYMARAAAVALAESNMQATGSSDAEAPFMYLIHSCI